jgi:putative DNA primase/helicase
MTLRNGDPGDGGAGPSWDDDELYPEQFEEIRQERERRREEEGGGGGGRRVPAPVPPGFQDLPMAHQFVDRIDGRLLQVLETGEWLMRDDATGIWKPTKSWFNHVANFMAEQAARVAQAEELEEEARERIRRQLLGGGKISAVANLIEKHPLMRTWVSEWKTDPWAIGTPGGLLDLRTGEVRTARLDERIRVSTAVLPKAMDTPVWGSFLDTTFKEDVEVIEFMQRWAGYMLSGDVSQHKLIFAYGPAATASRRSSTP